MNNQTSAAFVAVVLLLWAVIHAFAAAQVQSPVPPQLPDGPFFSPHYNNPVRSA